MAKYTFAFWVHLHLLWCQPGKLSINNNTIFAWCSIVQYTWQPIVHVDSRVTNLDIAA